MQKNLSEFVNSTDDELVLLAKSGHDAGFTELI